MSDRTLYVFPVELFRKSEIAQMELRWETFEVYVRPKAVRLWEPYCSTWWIARVRITKYSHTRRLYFTLNNVKKVEASLCEESLCRKDERVESAGPTWRNSNDAVARENSNMSEKQKFNKISCTRNTLTLHYAQFMHSRVHLPSRVLSPRQVSTHAITEADTYAHAEKFNVAFWTACSE